MARDRKYAAHDRTGRTPGAPPLPASHPFYEVHARARGSPEFKRTPHAPEIRFSRYSNATYTDAVQKIIFLRHIIIGSV